MTVGAKAKGGKNRMSGLRIQEGSVAECDNVNG